MSRRDECVRAQEQESVAGVVLVVVGRGVITGPHSGVGEITPHQIDQGGSNVPMKKEGKRHHQRGGGEGQHHPKRRGAKQPLQGEEKAATKGALRLRSSLL